MLPIQSIEGQTPTGPAEENGETRQQKQKNLPCKYCSKRFRRVEHVQRHERTHTKEKPFSCQWARCGKTFGRRDLLVRHEKLVHLNESNKDGNRPRKPSLGNSAQAGAPERHVDTTMLDMQPQPHYPPEAIMTSPVVASMPPDPRLPPRAAPACNLDLLSDAATHLASAGNATAMQPLMPELIQPSGGAMSRVKTYDEGMSYGGRRREQDADGLPTGFPAQPVRGSFDDYHLFLDDFTTTSHFLPPSIEAEQSFGLWPRDMQSRSAMKTAPSFPSTRFPSLQPDQRDPNDPARLHEDGVRAPISRISAMDHAMIKNRLDEFSSVLPVDFVFPSRHTLSRFLEGYISGFHEHLPFLHLPTLAPCELSPELLLAILAVGAQYRFESHRGHALWYAAKAVALEQIRRRHSHEVHGLLPTPAAYSPHSTRPSPSASYRHSFNSVQQERPMTQDTHREPYSPNTPQSRLETIQALLLLFTLGLWGVKAILHEALTLQSQLALLVRAEGLTAEANQAVDWETWIRIEGATRTKLIAYCFFNLCSIAYNIPPMLLTSEVNLYLPNHSRLWAAENAWQWQEVRQSYPNMEISLQDAFSRLLNRPSQGPLNVSSLGNYVLIHALIQHIYLLKQTSFAITSPFEVHRGLKVEDVEEVTQALRGWQIGFEQLHQLRAAEPNQQTLLDSFPGGPVEFNSTALLRLANFRLYTDLGPSRTLETRDPILIANGFNEAPLLVRSPRLIRRQYTEDARKRLAAKSVLRPFQINPEFVVQDKLTTWLEFLNHFLMDKEEHVIGQGRTDIIKQVEATESWYFNQITLIEAEMAQSLAAEMTGGKTGRKHAQPQHETDEEHRPAKAEEDHHITPRATAAATSHLLKRPNHLGTGRECWSGGLASGGDRGAGLPQPCNEPEELGRSDAEFTLGQVRL